jgi:hypothetical protein
VYLRLLVARTLRFLFLAHKLQAFAQFNKQQTPACKEPRESTLLGRYDIHADYSVVFPETNIVREISYLTWEALCKLEVVLKCSLQYDLVASNIWIAPDGVEVLGTYFNGLFPGPTIEASSGVLSVGYGYNIPLTG